jgi:hypothetical protein
MDGSPQRGLLHATTLWHFDAVEWAPSTASKADMAPRPRDVRFTPKSGHWNRHVYHLRRDNSDSLAIFAAIRRALSLVSSFAADSPVASPLETVTDVTARSIGFS